MKIRDLGLRLAVGMMMALAVADGPARAADPNQLMRLLDSRNCAGCKLQDADLIRADLRDGDLSKISLQRANLSGAQLDGANLKGANLSFTSFVGSTLRGADLRGAIMEGTDFREADLSGAQFDPDALARTHWRGAQGVTTLAQSYAELHNAGVESATKGRFPDAERLFGEAIKKRPDAAISWVARGITRSELGQTQLAAQDFVYASSLYEQSGDKEQAQELKQASVKLLAKNKKPGGNGLGSQLINGTMAALQFLAPLAMKAFSGI